MEVEEVIKKAKQGDKEALVRLVMLQKEAYYKLAYVYMKNKEDALDAIQDMIIIVYENIYRLRNEEAFYSWSKTILVNRCKVLLKAKSKINSLGSAEEGAYDAAISQQEDRLLLEQYLSQLNKKHQEVIRLRYFLDLDYKTIADLLKIPLGTVKSRIAIGLNKLKECLGGEEHARD
ncbi:RNA polymerase sigma factor [Cellulosilyticum sp. I15G10I2]|uniref:RNA polymerase sigma factor n=1 Tax=Cellulosilyticum sp. I15G10I2 TaxID=1892843 RepID=UPI00085C0FEE|nr:sigma-70 family RNA polymerase sigma factor [Cellulosilyticum sp. I15G10I2]